MPANINTLDPNTTNIDDNITMDINITNTMIIENNNEFVMGSLDTSSSWIIVVLIIALILFFFCLVICLIKDDLNLIGNGSNRKRKKKNIPKNKKGKRYEQCEDRTRDDDYDASMSDDSVSDIHEDYLNEPSSVSDDDDDYVGGRGRNSVESRDSIYDPQYWRHRTSRSLRVLKLVP